jgi:pilus assembly protein Flp/PilA
MTSFLNFLKREQGATAVEYAVMLALVILACLGGVLLLGQATSGSYSTTAQSIGNAMTGGS